MDYEIDEYGTKEWFIEGKLHREDGPAIEWNDGDKKWYKEGKFHREDGPAIECADGSEEWYLEGKLHREDGPAIKLSNGYKIYYYLDKRIKCKSDEEYFKLLKLKAFW